MHVLETWWEAWVHGYFASGIGGILWASLAGGNGEIRVSPTGMAEHLQTDPLKKMFENISPLEYIGRERDKEKFTKLDKTKFGQGKGFNVDLIKLISDAVSIPVIASSGAGAPQHFSEVFYKTNETVALAAGIFFTGKRLTDYARATCSIIEH
ncbi:Imidazole glycerol phosphate synthase hisHF, chloroplastic [Glycine soja]